MAVEQKRDEADDNRRSSKVRHFFKKYFLEGQKLDNVPSNEVQSNLSCFQRLFSSRRFWGIVIPLIFFEVGWWALAIKHNYFQYFPQKYIMSITMIFGALVAGMTSEGGGAVAFPVMTLAMSISPTVARDFSLMIQSCGMSAAAFAIYWMKIKVERNSLLFCSLGGAGGMIIGLEVIDELLTPPIKKLGFVSIWFSFSFALFLLNKQHKRKTYDNIQHCTVWKALLLILTGCAGGIFSSLSGSGIDICSFSMLCLLFRISEKVATPTSVMLMAINTCIGFFWRQFMSVGGAEREAWEFMAVCVPIVVFCAPMGSLISSHFHRQTLAWLVYLTDLVALVAALCLIPMYPNKDPTRIIVVIGLLVVGFAFFGLLCYLGGKYAEVITETTDEKEPENVEQSSENQGYIGNVFNKSLQDLRKISLQGGKAIAEALHIHIPHMHALSSEQSQNSLSVPSPYSTSGHSPSHFSIPIPESNSSC